MLQGTRLYLAVLIILALVVVGLGAYEWMRLSSNDRELAGLNGRIDQMTSRIDLLTEIVEAASARAVRAEKSAFEAAEQRTRAELESAEARAAAQLSAEQAREAIAEADRIREEREADLNRLEEALGALVETRRTALGLVMNLGSDAIQFDFDRAELRPENRELLSRIAGVLLTANGYSIYVYGHTDDVGDDQYNLDLSERRARAVRDYLIESGIRPEMITTRGYGKSSPRVAGTSPEARALNRRVEVGIVDVALDVRGPAR